MLLIQYKRTINTHFEAFPWCPSWLEQNAKIRKYPMLARVDEKNVDILNNQRSNKTTYLNSDKCSGESSQLIGYYLSLKHYTVLNLNRTYFSSGTTERTE
jgi:hypothetical protein